MRRRRSKPPSSSPRIRVKWRGQFWSKLWTQAGIPPYTWTQSGHAFESYSEITDYVGNKTLWNPVYHFKFKGHAGYEPSCRRQDGSVHTSCSQPEILLRAEHLKLTLPTPHTTPLKNVSRGALARASVWMPNSGSIANFLIELRGGLKEILPSVRKAKDLFGSLHLGIQFGTKAFLKDLTSIFRSWGEVQKRLRYLRRHNGQANWVRGHRSPMGGNPLTSEDYDVPADQTFMVWSDNPDTNPAVAHRAVKLHVVPESIVGTVHVNILVYFKLAGLEKFWTMMDMLSVALGLNNPVKIAWNATRYTWLLEYFVNVSPYLDKLAGQPFNGAPEIRAAWTSVKTVYQVEVSWGYVGSCNLKPAPPYFEKSGSFTVTKYERVPGLPYLSDEDLVSLNLSAQQLGIIAALTESRLSWDRFKWTKWAAYQWQPLLSPGMRTKLQGWRTPPLWFRNMFRKRRP